MLSHFFNEEDGEVKGYLWNSTSTKNFQKQWKQIMQPIGYLIEELILSKTNEAEISHLP